MKLLRLGIFPIFFLALSVGAAWGFEDAGECLRCHPSMTDEGVLHEAHKMFVTDCDWCHSDGGVFTNSSTNDPAPDGNGCSGCHIASGLRPIHIAATSENCGCHTSDEPITEDFVPPYYGTAATTYGESRSCWDNLDNDGDTFVDKGDEDCASVPSEWRSWSTIKEHYGE